MAEIASGPGVINPSKTAPEVAPQSTKSVDEKIKEALSLTAHRHASLRNKEEKIQEYHNWLKAFHNALPFVINLDDLINVHKTRKKAAHHRGDLSYQIFEAYRGKNEKDEPLALFKDGEILLRSNNGTIKLTDNGIDFIPAQGKEMSWDEAFRIAALAINDPRLLPPNAMKIKGTGFKVNDKNDVLSYGDERERWMIEQAVRSLATAYEQKVEFTGPPTKKPLRDMFTKVDVIGTNFIAHMPHNRESANFVTKAAASGLEENFLPPEPEPNQIEQEAQELEAANLPQPTDVVEQTPAHPVPTGNMDAANIMGAATQKIADDFQSVHEKEFSKEILWLYEFKIANDAALQQSDIISYMPDGTPIRFYNFTPSEIAKKQGNPDLQWIFTQVDEKWTMLEIHGMDYNSSKRIRQYRNPNVEYELETFTEQDLELQRALHNPDIVEAPSEKPGPTFSPANGGAAEIINRIHEEAQQRAEEENPPKISKLEWEDILTNNYADYLANNAMTTVEGSDRKKIFFPEQGEFPPTEIEFTYDGEKATVLIHHELPTAEEVQKQEWLNLITPRYEQLKQLGFIQPMKGSAEYPMEKMFYPVDSKEPALEILIGQRNGKLEIVAVTDLAEQERIISATMKQIDSYVNESTNREQARHEQAQEIIKPIEQPTAPVEIAAEPSTPVRSDKELATLEVLAMYENDLNKYPDAVKEVLQETGLVAHGQDIYKVTSQNSVFYFTQTDENGFKVTGARANGVDFVHPDYPIDAYQPKTIIAAAEPVQSAETPKVEAVEPIVTEQPAPQVQATTPQTNVFDEIVVQQPERPVFATSAEPTVTAPAAMAIEPVPTVVPAAAVIESQETVPPANKMLDSEYHEVLQIIEHAPDFLEKQGKSVFMKRLQDLRELSGNNEPFKITYEDILDRLKNDGMVEMKDSYKTGDKERIYEFSTFTAHSNHHRSVVQSMINHPEKYIGQDLDSVTSKVQAAIELSAGKESDSLVSEHHAKNLLRDLGNDHVYHLDADKKIIAIATGLAKIEKYNLSSGFNKAATTAEPAALKLVPVQAASEPQSAQWPATSTKLSIKPLDITENLLVAALRAAAKPAATPLEELERDRTIDMNWESLQRKMGPLPEMHLKAAE